MADEMIMENQPETQPDNKPSAGAKFKATVREWFRKKIVALKVRPQKIPLAIMVITTVYFMLILFSVSHAVSLNTEPPATGICTFITTLLSLLYLVSFLNAFPKRKKPSIFFIVLVGVMIAAMLACDIVYYLQTADAMAARTDHTAAGYTVAAEAQPYVIGHMVLLGISAVVFALLPVYGRLIKKIDTSVRLDSATEHMNGKIDIEEDD